MFSGKNPGEAQQVLKYEITRRMRNRWNSIPTKTANPLFCSKLTLVNRISWYYYEGKPVDKEKKDKYRVLIKDNGKDKQHREVLKAEIKAFSELQHRKDLVFNIWMQTLFNSKINSKNLTIHHFSLFLDVKSSRTQALLFKKIQSKNFFSNDFVPKIQDTLAFWLNSKRNLEKNIIKTIFSDKNINPSFSPMFLNPDYDFSSSKDKRKTLRIEDEGLLLP